MGGDGAFLESFGSAAANPLAVVQFTNRVSHWLRSLVLGGPLPGRRARPPRRQAMPFHCDMTTLSKCAVTTDGVVPSGAPPIQLSPAVPTKPMAPNPIGTSGEA